MRRVKVHWGRVTGLVLWLAVLVWVCTPAAPVWPSPAVWVIPLAGFAAGGLLTMDR